MMRPRLALAVVIAAATALTGLALASCDGCTPPPADDDDDDGNEGEGEGDAGEGEGEGDAGEGEGEGEGDGPQPDAGTPDPDVSGLDARPSNTTCLAADRPVFETAVAGVEPWPNLSVFAPMLLLQEPGTDTMYVIERAGFIVRWNKNDTGVTDPEVFGNIAARVDTTDSGNDERGLLGMAFHPEWPVVEELYLSYSGNDGGGALVDRVSRFTLGGDGLLDENSEEVLLDTSSEAANHNGGMIAFSPTDPCTTCLYVGYGDGGSANDPNENGQDLGALLGKMLRIDVAGSGAGPFGNYSVPLDNPFVGVGGAAPEVFALGLRNPWRWSFDRGSGDLWVGDVGQGQAEEVSFVEAGGNYGWDIFEASRCRAGEASDNYTQEDCDQGGFIDPVVEYGRNVGSTVVGGYVYRGTGLPSLAGTYFFAEFSNGQVFTIQYDLQGNPQRTLAVDFNHQVASFGEDSDGELYVMDHVTGVIKQLVPAGPPPPPDNFPTTLSASGCADPGNATLPAPGLVPYGTAHSLYSDGAVKDRFVGMPDGQNASILADGDIDFPVGTVFRKDFRVQGALIETRLLMRHDDGDWGGYSYEWNAAGNDADLVDQAGKTKTLANGQQWTYPSRNGCLLCHSSAANRVLGLEIAQLNVGFLYEQTGRLANQLTTWDDIGMFAGPLPDAVDALPSLPPVDDAAATAEEKARAYLHVNCSICHRPGGLGVGDTDWRFTTGFGDMQICNVTPTEGDQGVAGALRLVPGDPALSLMSIRMKRLGVGRMPPLATVIVDPEGTAVVDEWITSLTACP